MEASTLAGVPPSGNGWRFHAATQEWWLYRGGEVTLRVTAEVWAWYRAECERTGQIIPM